jgi:G5 domain
VQNQTTSDSWQQLLETPRKSWWARLPFGVRMTAGASAVLVLVGGGAAGVAALTAGRPRIVTAAGRESAVVAAVQPEAPEPPANGRAAPLGTGLGNADLGARAANAGTPEADLGVAGRTSDEADRTATRTPRRTGIAGEAAGSSGTRAGVAVPQTPGTATGPVITTQTVTETRPIPYRTRLVRDPSLPRGTQRVQTPGVPGEQTLRWLVTRTDGKETDRRLIDTTVTREPQTQVIAFGWQGGGGWRHRHMRECDAGLDPCLPLGRSACPAGARPEESAVQLGGSLPALDRDLGAVDQASVDGIELDPSLCPQPASG